MLECPKIVAKLNYLADNTTNFDENDINEGVHKQERIVKEYGDILKVREERRMQQIEENITLSDMEGPNAHVIVL